MSATAPPCLSRRLVLTGLVALPFVTGWPFTAFGMPRDEDLPDKSARMEVNNSKLIKTIQLESGAFVPGRIEAVFQVTVSLHNTNDYAVRYRSPVGQVFVVAGAPHKYQYVTTVAGFTTNVPPGTNRTETFYVFCCWRDKAEPPIGRALVSAGMLPDTVVDLLLSYRDGPDQDETRKRVIDAINSNVKQALSLPG